MKTKYIFLSALYAVLASCGSNDVQGPKEEKSLVASSFKTQKQFNINILWDLSDRIDPTKNPAAPDHYQRDIEVIKDITELFKQDMDSKGAYLSKGKLKVFFTPTPSDNSINTIAQNLSVDLSQFKGENASKDKKKVFDSITSQFEQNANRIYGLTIQSNKGNSNWDGSDIWRFFKDESDKVIESDTNYRNILVILTDGYIYHKDSKGVSGHRSQFILPQTLVPFRNNPNWEKLIVEKDYGLMGTGKKLPNLEVLVLEVTPTKGNRNDADYISAYLEKWFTEMDIKKFKIYPSDLPTYTKSRIESFIKS